MTETALQRAPCDSIDSSSNGRSNMIGIVLIVVLQCRIGLKLTNVRKRIVVIVSRIDAMAE